MAPRIGFMQGRLSPLVDGKIQAFPWEHWRREFSAAQALGLDLMEWTLDHARLAENPLMTVAGRAEIADLSRRFGVEVGSLTGDIFMQAPFWKQLDRTTRARWLSEFDDVLSACAAARIAVIVVPLVDNGAMQSRAQEDVLVEALLERANVIRVAGMRVAFECDYPPQQLSRFIGRLPADAFGINYDIGNSAALGYDCADELAAYAQRIVNVHVKDRVKGGTTVPLGTGNADLPRVLRLLPELGYRGHYILQTARAGDGDHAGALARYRDLCRDLIGRRTS